MAVENLIYQHDGQQLDLLLYFHEWLTVELQLEAKITFDNPCYYGKSWICYLRPTQTGGVELTFLRGNELSNDSGLLEDKGRKQLRSIEFNQMTDVPVDLVSELFQEAILLDEVKPYRSKRKK